MLGKRTTTTTVRKYPTNKRGPNYALPFSAPRIVNTPQFNAAVSRAVNTRVNRGLKTEVKTVDSTIAMSFSNDGTVAQTMTLVNTIAQDASPTTRIGKKVMMTAIAIRGNAIVNTVLANARATLLLVYVRNNNQASTLPAWTEILVTQGSTALTNRDNASKFKILRRWDYKLIGDQDSTTPTTDNLQLVEEFVKFKKPLEACWTTAGTAGTIGQFEKGSLLLISVGSIAQAAPAPVFNGNTRVYFTDA